MCEHHCCSLDTDALVGLHLWGIYMLVQVRSREWEKGLTGEKGLGEGYVAGCVDEREFRGREHYRGPVVMLVLIEIITPKH
jgi:hypothetical protein